MPILPNFRRGVVWVPGLDSDSGSGRAGGEEAASPFRGVVVADLSRRRPRQWRWPEGVLAGEGESSRSRSEESSECAEGEERRWSFSFGASRGGDGDARAACFDLREPILGFGPRPSGGRSTSSSSSSDAVAVDVDTLEPRRGGKYALTLLGEGDFFSESV